MSIYKYAESTEHAMIFSEALYLNTLVSFSTFNEKNHYKSYITLGWRKRLDAFFTASSSRSDFFIKNFSFPFKLLR